MPWTSKDVGRHNKKAAKSKGGAKKWAKRANAIRARMMSQGMSEKEADAHAIRIANASMADRVYGSKK